MSNIPKIYKKLKDKALKGDIKSIFLLGKCHEKGLKGVNADLNEAFNWYAKAAEKGFAPAQKKLGEMYFYGLGVPSNIQRAREWYQKASLNDDIAKLIKEEENKYGNVLKVDFNKKQIIFDAEDKALIGDAQSLFELGIKKFISNEDKDPEYEKAFEYFIKAANLGHDKSMFQVAYMYEMGIGVSINNDEAFKWYLKSAENGNLDSAHNLGLMYQDGRGTKQNFTLAYKWYKKASEKGCALSENKIGVLYFMGNGVPKDYNKSFKWYMKSALKGYKFAEYNLAYSYFHGYGITKDYKEAFKWFKISADKDHPSSQEYLGRMLGFGIGIEENIDEAISYCLKAFYNGNTSAAFCLAQIYQKKKNDTEKAIFYYKEAENKDDVNSVFSLANIYLYGEHNKNKIPDYKLALKYCEKMVSLGETYVNEEIGDIYFNLKKYRLAYLYYEKAYRLTSVDGLKGIGDLYYNGFYLKQNYKKALYCYKKYYRKGGYKAYSCLKNIGDIYFKILKDDKNALYWYLKASRLEKSDFSFLKNVNENILKIYLKHEKYEKVIKFVKKNEFLKNSDTCQFLMGHAYLALKDEKNAFVCYLKVAGMQTHLNMNVRAIVSYLAKDKKTDVFGDIDAKNAIIRSSPYSKYLIGHNFFKGKYGHPKSYRHAKKWLLLAGMEGVKKAFIDLYHIAIHNEDIIEIETYKYFVPYEISKAYKCKKLSKDQEKLVLQNIKDLKNKIKFDSKFKKVEKKVVQEKLFGFLEKNNHKIISNPIINNIQINGLLYSNNKIIPIIIIDNIPLENKDLLRINKESLISNDKRLKNLTTDIEKIKDFLKEHFSDKEIIPLLISTRSMPFYQDKEFFIHRNFFLKDIGEMPSVINEEATPISKDLDEKIHKIIKTSFIKRIFGFIKKY